MSAAKKIPFTVIGGFLGAGKTSWLNRRIMDGLPQGSVIVVNDFGSVNIDAELIEYQDDQILKLANGCICCSLGGTLAEQLVEVIRRSPAAIYVEASGVADPARIVDIARLSPVLEPAGIDCLVDASQIPRHCHDIRTREIWQAQIRSSTRLWINRLPSEDTEVESLLDILGNINPKAEYHLDRSQPAVPVSPKANQEYRNGQMTSFSLRPRGPVDVRVLETALADYNDVVLRAKGVLPCEGQERVQILQLAGGKIRWTPAGQTMRKTALVVIGLGGQRFKELQRLLEKQLS